MSASAKQTVNLEVNFTTQSGDPLPYIESKVFEIRDFDCLMKAMGWRIHPIIEDEYRHHNGQIYRIQGRVLLDDKVLGAACCSEVETLLEIGTYKGRRTVIMARNARKGMVYTVNIDPEENRDECKIIGSRPTAKKIGIYYRTRGITNVTQIIANTAIWEPDIGTIDLAFIDGCHDAEFVYSDTVKILKNCRSGSLILWHDFNPSAMKEVDFIAEVCRGINQLFADGHLTDNILHLPDSWIGLYRVP